MSLPKISIITPCYNAAKYIEEMILSIVEQGYENLEFIIIDAGSKDGTVDIIKKYEKHLSYWVSEPDKGQSDAINKGIQKATGDVFNWINADDYLLPGSLKLVGEAFKNSNTNVFCSRTNFLHPDGSLSINGITKTDDKPEILLNTRGLNQMGMYWKMDLIKKLNGVDSNFRFSMDLDLWKRYLLTFGTSKISSTQEITAVFRFHEESKTGVDLQDNLSVFEMENNAALWIYAAILGQNELKKIQFLYHTAKQPLANGKTKSELPILALKTWLNLLFFTKARQFFYEENYKTSYFLLKYIDKGFLPKEEITNFKHYKRTSILKKWLKK